MVMINPKDSLLYITKQQKGLSPDSCLPSLLLQMRQIILPQSEDSLTLPSRTPGFLVSLLIDFCDPVDLWGQRWHQRGRRKQQTLLPNHFFVIRGVLRCADSITAQRP